MRTVVKKEWSGVYMTTAKSNRPHIRKKSRPAPWMLFLKGLLAAGALTAALVIVFAIIVGVTDAADGVIRIVNQAIKIVSILLGVWIFVPKGQSGGALRGALMGLAYMAVGLLIYIAFTHQQASAVSCLTDVLMGVSIGGLAGMLRSQQCT